MKQERSEKWKEWRDTVAKRSAELARSYGGSDLAVALNAIAEFCQIKTIIFRPLLVEGGLAIGDDGLLMFVKCDSDLVEQYKVKYFEFGGIGLPPRVRFTIAHEIVHTFFLDLKKPTPTPRVKGNHPRELQSLEETCNFGAGRLLLPPDRFNRFLAEDDFLVPSSLCKWADAFCVSIQTMIRRLSEVPTWNSMSGAAAIIKQCENGMRIQCLATDRYARPLFANVGPSSDVRDLVFHSSLTMFGGTKSEVPIDLLGQRAGKEVKVPSIVSCRPLTAKPRSYLLTVRLAEKV